MGQPKSDVAQFDTNPNPLPTTPPQWPGAAEAPQVSFRRDNDLKLSCRDEGRLVGSLRPESRPPASSASTDMLSRARVLIAHKGSVIC